MIKKQIIEKLIEIYYEINSLDIEQYQQRKSFLCSEVEHSANISDKGKELIHQIFVEIGHLALAECELSIKKLNKK